MAMIDLVLGAAMAMLATSLGAAGIFMFGRFGLKSYDVLLSFCAGIMMVSAIEMFLESHNSVGDIDAIIWLICGIGVFVVIEKILPHVHYIIRKKKIGNEDKKTALLAGTITLHNVPEGFAIASAFASSSPLGWLVATAIAVQDIPEGLTVSAPLANYGISKKRSFLLGVFSGFVEFLAAIFGFLFLNIASQITPLALAFSAGAMGYVAFFELLLETLKGKASRASALSFVFGIAVAFILTLII